LEPSSRPAFNSPTKLEEESMDGLIYLVGLIVIIMFVLSLLGLH
jgi:hypothetical protein